jgi:4,5-dihydroxyphthalate decarboxylase
MHDRWDMAGLALSICFWNYDRTMPLVDGRVPIEGCDPRFAILAPEEAFARAFGTAEFDVSELSLSNYMSSLSRDDAAYTAIPVFPSRAFRHSTIYVRSDRGIKTPGDLVGKTVGLQEYDMTAAVVVRGLLRDEYAVMPSDIAWRVGDVETPRRATITVPTVPGVEIASVAPGRMLNDMLAEGTLDALVALMPPSSFAAGNPDIVRLFSDWRREEQAYFARTRFFPIMHTVGIRRTLLARHPWLALALFQCFSRAKEIAVSELAVLQASKVTLPWVVAELEATRATMGPDFWPYGVAANRPALERLADYHYREGLSSRRLAVEELFIPSTLAL